MTIQFIPISAVPAQTFTIQLNSQNCMINIYQKNTGLFFDLEIDNNPCVTSVLCLNLVGLVRESYYGFTGQLAFFDTQGTSDPTYDGLGSRYQLIYQS
jgi:hypothetical protein